MPKLTSRQQAQLLFLSHGGSIPARDAYRLIAKGILEIATEQVTVEAANYWLPRLQKERRYIRPTEAGLKILKKLRAKKEIK